MATASRLRQTFIKPFRMAKDAIVDGVFAINKPTGMSSAQVIRDCQIQFNPSAFFAPALEREKAKRASESPKAYGRRSRNKKELRVKMGHGGTLDPLASGVLILGLGSGTKALQGFLDCTKTYETVVLFGASTDTYDRVGRILTRRPYEHITKDMVLEAMESFRGKHKQVPPIYSALKMEGKPLYEYAREGLPIPREIPTRDVDVKDLELLEWYEPGTHAHRWPTEEADAVECQFAEKVWKQAESRKSMTPEEAQEEAEAIAAHEAVKRKFEDDVDGLVKDRPASKKQRKNKQGNLNRNNQKGGAQGPMMSGALAETEPNRENSDNQKGANLIPAIDPNAPPPWKDKGPAAARIRFTVSSGFYVRSFCHDLGLKVKSAAMMAELCRSRQGDFEVGTPSCLSYEDITKGEEVWAPKVAKMLENWAHRHRAPKKQPAVAAVVPSTESAPRAEKERKEEKSDGPATAPASTPATEAPSANAAPKTTEEDVPAEQVSVNGHAETLAAAESARDDDEESWKGFQD